MLRVRCDRCATDVAMNDAYRRGEQTFCNPCLESERGDANTAAESPPDLTRLIDPTVCAFCRTDAREPQPERVAGHPSCTTCADRMRRHPLPGWFPIAAAVIAIVVVAAFAQNWRFVRAEINVVRANRAFGQGQAALASTLMTSAATAVPEVTDIATFAMFFKGISLVQSDRSAEALPLLRSVQNAIGKELVSDALLLRLEAGAAFDAKDYDRFLDRAQALANATPKDWVAVAQVASAYACKYATVADDRFRQQALEYLERARRLDADPTRFQEYADRIHHRLDSREIITAAEYNRRFRSKQPAGVH